MLKIVTAFCAAVLAGSFFVSSATDAEARARRAGCCGASVKTTHVYKTKNVYKRVTRYRDVWRTRQVRHTHRVVHVTRIRPVIRVHMVKRVHYRNVAVVRRVHVHKTQWLPAKRIVTSSVRHYGSKCRCSR